MRRVLVLIFLSLFLATTAGAAGNHQEFGNNKYPDCIYAADANLEETYNPGVILTNAQVIQAFQANGESYGLAFMQITGFDGITANITPMGTSIVGLQAAVAVGGVQAFVRFPYQGEHAIAVIAATNTRVEFVSWGYTYWWSLKEY